MESIEITRKRLLQGLVIPAHPLALDAQRTLDERRQRALSRYYLASGAGGLAVGVHTTQFAIHRPEVGLLRPVLNLASEEMDRADQNRAEKVVRVMGICGDTRQAVTEATMGRDLGYHAGLLNLAAMADATEGQLISHCRAVADTLPVFGFYLQPAVGGIRLPVSFWQRFFEIDQVVAVKIATFNRYQTLDVLRAAAESGRSDIAIYTGNDDAIVQDLITPFRFRVGDRTVEQPIVGGLLGHWSAWTSKAPPLLEQCRRSIAEGTGASPDLLALGAEVTDCNAALFDAANDFHGCVPGIHEVLRRQGLLEGTWCLDENEKLGPGQSEELDRVTSAYPHLTDDPFVAENRDAWLSG